MYHCMFLTLSDLGSSNEKWVGSFFGSPSSCRNKTDLSQFCSQSFLTLQGIGLTSWLHFTTSTLYVTKKMAEVSEWFHGIQSTNYEENKSFEEFHLPLEVCFPLPLEVKFRQVFCILLHLLFVKGSALVFGAMSLIDTTLHLQTKQEVSTHLQSHTLNAIILHWFFCELLFFLELRSVSTPWSHFVRSCRPADWRRYLLQTSFQAQARKPLAHYFLPFTTSTCRYTQMILILPQHIYLSEITTFKT